MPPRGTSGTPGGGGTRNGGLHNPGIQPQLWNLIRVYSQRLNLDPYAVAAVSRVEGGGRFGEVNPTSGAMGPFQLLRGGALPPGRDAAWVNSAAGVWYAMSHMAAAGASGLRGLPAVRAIVTRFERPGNPAAEVTSAWSGYGAGADRGNFAVGPVESPGTGQWIQAMHNMMTRQAQMFQQGQANTLQQMIKQAAQQRQQGLSAAAQAQQQQLVGAAQQAQRGLNTASQGITSVTPAASLYGEKKGVLDTIRSSALRRAGIYAR